MPKKTLGLVDAENLYYTPKKLWGPGAKVDFQRLYSLITNGGRPAEVIAYLVADPIIDQTLFINRLVKIGYTPKVKAIYHRKGKYQNSNWDDEIIEDALELIDKTDKLILVSGDGDFIPMLKAYRKQEKQVHIICFQNDFCPQLKSVADSVTFLDEEILLNPHLLRPHTSYQHPRPEARGGCRFPMQ